jgi:hypothetical protein
MVELSASADDPLKFLLPLPDGVSDGDPRLFGMWTYELRYGHTDPWSLAHARYGRPLRVAGVQHPAPELPCVASWQRVSSLLLVPPQPGGGLTLTRTIWKLVATAAYATPVAADGHRVGTGFPLTTIGFLVYAQVLQADGSGYRNVLLTHLGATPVEPRQTPGGIVYDYGSAVFAQADLEGELALLGLPEEAPLSVVAVEFYSPGGNVEEVGAPGVPSLFPPGLDPFAQPNFGTRRILRTSVLVKVEPFC